MLLTVAEFRSRVEADLASLVIELDLQGAQFRCAGSAEYVDWAEGLLQGDPASRNRVRASAWRFEMDYGGGSVVPMQHVAQPSARYASTNRVRPANSPRFRAPFEFRIVDNPEELEAALRSRLNERKTVRLLSSFSREWITKDKPNPHGLPPELRDFNVPYAVGGRPRTWSRIWNYAPKADYTWFVQAREGGKMAEDPLCEVGCPYVVRGFDYDYLGILWLDDLVWRGGRWKVNELRRRTAQAYRILLTRALCGIYVWILDPETKQHVEASLAN